MSSGSVIKNQNWEEMWSNYWMMYGATRGLNTNCWFSGFFYTTDSIVQNKITITSKQHVVGENALLMREVRVEWPAWCNVTEKQQYVK